MATILLPESDLREFFKLEKRWHFAKQAEEHANKMAVHGKGIYPKELIEERRPNESDEVKQYREKIWVAKTKPAFDKIVSSLNKIRRSSGWSITYDNAELFTRIPDDEKLETYCEKKYPGFTSVTNWVFAVLLKQYLIDPNSIILVHPLNRNVEENQFLQPICTLFGSDDIVYFDDAYGVFINKAGSKFTVRGRVYEGKSFFVVTQYDILRYDQTDNKGTMTLVDEYPLPFVGLPFFRLKSIVAEQYSNNILYESRISGIIPELDEALREYSDLQAAKVLHIYPERWEYTNKECTGCKGTGKRKNEAGLGKETTCETCNGTGYVVAGPYSKIIIKPAGIGEQQLPTPPAGYVEKDVEIVKIQEESVSAHIYAALASINFEFLMKSPVAQSGIAKEFDKDELNNTVQAIAEDIIAAMDEAYYLIAKYRYSIQYPDDTQLRMMLPMIAVPEKFDLVSYKNMEQELNEAKQNKVNPVILNRMELEYASKRFVNDAAMMKNLELVLKADPLQGYTIDEKSAMYQSRVISKRDFILSCNINQFIDRALAEYPDFYTMDGGAQMAILDKYADEIELENSTQQEIIGDVQTQTGNTEGADEETDIETDDE